MKDVIKEGAIGMGVPWVRADLIARYRYAVTET
jgi:hypothetical protein